MVIQCAGTLNPGLRVDQLQLIWRPVIHSYKLLINDVKSVHLLTHFQLHTEYKGAAYINKRTLILL